MVTVFLIKRTKIKIVKIKNISKYHKDHNENFFKLKEQNINFKILEIKIV